MGHRLWVSGLGKRTQVYVSQGAKFSSQIFGRPSAVSWLSSLLPWEGDLLGRLYQMMAPSHEALYTWMSTCDVPLLTTCLKQACQMLGWKIPRHLLWLVLLSGLSTQACKPKGCWINPQLGHMPGLQA